MKKIRATRYAIRVILIVLIILGALQGLYQAGFIQGILCNFTAGDISVSCPLGFIQLSLSVQILVLALLVSSLFFIVISLIFGRVFCSWICPMGLVTETVHYLKRAVLRRRTKHTGACSQCSTSPSSPSPRFPGMLSIGRSVKYVFLASVIIVSIVVRYPVFCLICPVGILCRNLLSLSSFQIFTLEVSIVGVIFLSDFFLFDRGWCGGLCPLGAFYSLLGNTKLVSLRVGEKKVCEEPLCQAVCPKGAIHRDEKTGGISVDDNLCAGCKECTIACLFGSPTVNMEKRTIECVLCDAKPKCFESTPAKTIKPSGPSTKNKAHKNFREDQ